MRSFYLFVFFVLALTFSGLCQEIEFDKPFDIRERLGIPENVAFQVTSSAPNVYVLWVFFNRDAGDRLNLNSAYSLNLAYSNDGGNNFDVRVLYSNMSDAAPVVQPQMAASGDTIHVAFFLGSSRSLIHYCRIPPGEDLPCARPIRGIGFNEADNLRLAAAGDNVYIAWNNSVGDGNVYLIYSTDGGETFSKSINLTNDGDARNTRQLTDLVATGNEVYLRWRLSGLLPCPECPHFLMHGVIVESKFTSSY